MPPPLRDRMAGQVPPVSFATPLLEKKQDGLADGLAENTLLALVRTGIENDFEEVVFLQHPSLREIKRQLMGMDTEAPAFVRCALWIGFGPVWTLRV